MTKVRWDDDDELNIDFHVDSGWAKALRRKSMSVVTMSDGTVVTFHLEQKLHSRCCMRLFSRMDLTPRWAFFVPPSRHTLWRLSENTRFPKLAKRILRAHRVCRD